MITPANSKRKSSGRPSSCLTRSPDWVTFYREVFGLRGIVRQAFPSRDSLAAFEQTEAYHETPAPADEASPAGARGVG